MAPQNSTESKSFYQPFRILSYLVLALMLASSTYAFIMTGLHWTGINV